MLTNIKKEMKELEKILKDLQKRGYQQVDIGQVLSWMYDIQRENRLKRAERRQLNIEETEKQLAYLKDTFQNL